MTDAIADAFADGPAFIPYIAAGDPGTSVTPDDPREAARITRRYVAALVRGGADIVELGLPFSEPIADGPTIREATTRALEAGMTPPRLLALVEDLTVSVPVVVMTYYNPIYRYGGEPGVEAFVADAAAAGVDAVIVPDLPVEESEPLARACAGAGIDLIFIAAPTTRDDRLDRILEVGTGYLYVQARLGTTGARVEISDQTRDSLARIRRFEERRGADSIPKAVGFGISSGEQAATVTASGADGIIVGSALVDRIAAAETVEAAERALERDARELAEGTAAGYRRRAGGPETS